VSERHAALHRAIRILGASAVTLVAADTGATIWTLTAPDEPAADGASVADVSGAVADLVDAAVAVVRLTEARHEFDDLVLSSDAWFHVLRLLPGADGADRPDDDCVVHLRLDRRRANLALARHELRAMTTDQRPAALPPAQYRPPDRPAEAILTIRGPVAAPADETGEDPDDDTDAYGEADDPYGIFGAPLELPQRSRQAGVEAGADEAETDEPTVEQ
jgi:hypothetical protein